MDVNDLLQKANSLKEKLNRAQRQLVGLKEKSKYLEMQYEDSRGREQHTNELVMELLERQRELNVMLNRANIMLNRTQETMALTSMEFNEMAKALPEPKKAEWSDRVAKINELFKKSGIQDAELTALESSNQSPREPFDAEEMKKESEEAFGKKESIWSRFEKRKPPKVEAVVVEEVAEVVEETPAAANVVEEVEETLAAVTVTEEVEETPAAVTITVTEEVDEIPVAVEAVDVVETPVAAEVELIEDVVPDTNVEQETFISDQETDTESTARTRVDELFAQQNVNEDNLIFGPRKKSWWQRKAG